MIETVGVFAAKTVAAYAFTKGFDRIFHNKESFEKRLSKVIDSTIDAFRKKNPIPDKEGKFAFYDSQIIMGELLEVRFFGKTGRQFDTAEILFELKKNPNILMPSTEQLTSLLNIFEKNLKADKQLKKLAIDENYRSEIFHISGKIDVLLAQLKENSIKPEATPKELTAMTRIPKKEIIGRETDLNNLRNSLVEESETAVINGMGGIGKTTLAAVYLSEYYHDYAHIA